MFILGGCVYTHEPMPEVWREHPSNKTIITPILPPPTRPTVVAPTVITGVPPNWLPPKQVKERNWNAIVVHHSGTSNGNAAIFDDWHRNGKHWEGVGYDFVIGNGSNSGDGQVEVTFRWREQRTGAHCKTPSNWANEQAVGICLVGNFNQTRPTTRQMQSLVKLIGFLQKRYRIPKSRIYGHRDTPGAGRTECPGRRFPMVSLKSMLSF